MEPDLSKYVLEGDNSQYAGPDGLVAPVLIRAGQELGDTGQTAAFGAIAKRYGPFDVAMLEIGQWNEAWEAIHLGPIGALDAFEAMHTHRLLPIHWSTFELALHSWSEPAETLYNNAYKRGLALSTPLLGEPIEPATAKTSAWWRELPPIAKSCP